MTEPIFSQDSARFSDAGKAFSDLCRTIAALRHPNTGCPWDLKQTHSSLRQYMIEEAYEATAVMDPPNYSELKGELGDVLLQVVLNAQVACDDRQFQITDVINSLNHKMIRRHPHVFAEIPTNDTSDEGLKLQWETIKREERTSSFGDPNGVFAHIPRAGKFPPLMRAIEIGKAARSIAFDWPDPLSVLTQVRSELDELENELVQRNEHDTNKSKTTDVRIAQELSDVFFTLSQLSRHLGINPELVAEDGNRKFLERFANLEKIARSQNIDVRNAGFDTLQLLWTKAKNEEHS
jgi:nucleoside triphosphate diphosphatase